MEGTISEIRLFAGNFSPRYWAYCQGQTLNIQSNQALFALIGTYYGGNGTSNFMLPDLRGRTVVGVGQGQGLTAYTIGQKVGVNTVQLNTTQMPMHTHNVMVTQGTGSGTGSVTLNGINDVGGQAQPGGNFLSQDNSGAGVATYAAPGSGTPVAMAPSSLVVAGIAVPPPVVTIANNGAGSAHDNMMPSIALNYVICLQGVFPSRN